MFVCEFCGKELTTKSSLKTHKDKAKYCLEKQNRRVDVELKCVYCDRGFNYKHIKNSHEVICPVRIENERLSEVNKLKDEIKDYKSQIDCMAKEIENLKAEKLEIYEGLYNKDQQFILEQSKRLVEKAGVTTTINAKNITMNALNLSQERMESLKDTYTMNHYERGGKGQADWVIENVLKDEHGNLSYKCTDKNRRNFMYRDDKGNIVNDMEAKKLKEAIFPVMNNKVKEFKIVKCEELAEVSDDENELLEKYSNLYNENKSLGHEFEKRLVDKTYNK